jgi:hypothetical protein
VLVLAPPPNAMVLLGEVRQLEVEAECAEDEALFLQAERRIDRRDRAGLPGGPGVDADALDEVEQPLALLLDEDAAEQRSEQADVAPDGRRAVAFRRQDSRPSARRTCLASGSTPVTLA